MVIRNYAQIPALAALFALSACGGGGGGGSIGPVTSTETFQLRTAWVNYVTDSRSMPFSLSGTISGVNVTGSGTVTQGSLSSTTFESQSALQKTTTVTGSISANGSTIPLSTSSTNYVDTSYNPLGSNDGTDYTVVNNGAAIPTTGRVNDTGTWYSSVRYTSSAKTTRRGTDAVSFVLEPDTASTALLKIINIERDTSNTVTSTSTVTFRMTPGGSLTRLSESTLQGTTSLNITY